jgi:hypothetical protein
LRIDDGDVLDVNPQGARASAAGLRERSLAVAAQGRACGQIGVPCLVAGGQSIEVALSTFSSAWGLAVTALAHELDLLGGELGRQVECVVSVDEAGAR